MAEQAARRPFGGPPRAWVFILARVNIGPSSRGAGEILAARHSTITTRPRDVLSLLMSLVVIVVARSEVSQL